MNPTAAHRLPALLEAAAHRVKLAARTAVERTVESLGLAALATGNVFQRDTLLGAQFELNRKSSFFAIAFNEDLDERLLREYGPRRGDPGFTNWDALSLVDDQEVERKVAAERFGLEIAHACEWELRELDAYMGSLLGTTQDRDPLRPEIVGLALIKGIEATSERAEIRSVLLSELGRILAAEMRGTYTAIVGDLRKAGVQPAGLSVKPTSEHGRHVSGYDSLHDAPESLRSPEAASRSGYSSRAAPVSTGRGRLSTHSSSSGARLGGTPLGHVDAQLMSLIRRLAYVDPVAVSDAASSWGESAGGAAPLPPNLIRAHRDELRQASKGSIDHMVIDVIGSLFDQILSDPKVPPQMARQIGRLQLPVLRAALGDPSFFSSRRHPVRRFVNRIASLGAAFDDFADDDAKRFLARVKALVQDIVEGDFDQIEVYESKLTELERFIADLTRAEVEAQGDPAAVLGEKETELRLTRRYAAQLQAELKGLEGPDFVRDFLTEVWSQVLMQAAQRHGPDSERFTRLRAVARELFMSVQPKSAPAQRKEFLAQLPKLMQGLNEGMDLIAWPEAARKAFFGLLLPAHAESLKGQGRSTLEYNLLAKRVEGAFQAPLPRRDDLPPADVDLPVLNDAIAEPSFSPEEAARIGLMDESKVDWSAPVAPAAEAEPVVTTVDIDITGLPKPEPVEDTSGRGLADNVQLGYAYQMHLDDDWHKVRLTHVSPGRNFFVFSRGKRHKQTISLTHRMLVRLCETGRLRAFESAYLLERATARARRQLASLGASA
jgi:hypothetical protein